MRSGLFLAALLAAARLGHSEAAEDRAGEQRVELRFARAEPGDAAAVAGARKVVTLDEKGSGQIEFATPTGRLLIRRAGDGIFADSNGDGSIDEEDDEGVLAERAGGTISGVLGVQAVVGGRTVRYPIRVLAARGRRVVLAGEGVLVGGFAGGELRLFDTDVDGVFGEVEADAILVRAPRGKRAAVPSPAGAPSPADVMARVIEIGGELYDARMLDGGAALGLARHEGPTATLELEAEDAVVELTLSLRHTEGARCAKAGLGTKALLVPGSYRITGSRLALKLPPREEGERSLLDVHLGWASGPLKDAGILVGARGGEPTLVTVRPGENCLRAGPPFRLDFAAFVWEKHGDRLEVPDAALVGAAGERYVPELGGAGRETCSLKTFFRSNDGEVPSRRLACGRGGLSGGPIQVPDGIRADPKAEFAVRFEAPGIGRVSAKKRLSDLPGSKPSLRGLTAAAKEAEWFGRYAEAVRLFEEAVGHYPGDDGLSSTYAWLLLTVKDETFRDAPRALVMARRAAELTNEHEGYILDTLAEALYQTGELEEAAKYAAAAAEKDPHPEVRARAARFREELERKRAGEN